MNHTYKPTNYFLVFSFVRILLTSCIILAIVYILTYFFNYFILKVIWYVTILLVPLDILLEFMQTKRQTLIIKEAIVYLEEGIIFRKRTIIPREKIYTLTESMLPIFENKFKTLVFKTVVKDFKFEGLSIANCKEITTYFEGQTYEKE